MELAEVLARRRMVRDFDPDRPVDDRLLESMLLAALRSPSAGNSQGTHFVVLTGPETARFWDVSLPEPRRRDFAFPGLLAAPVLVLPVAEPAAYLARYSEPDKPARLGASTGAWDVPYWLVDTSFATMTLLLEVTDAGLGACFFGLFDNGPAVCEALGIPGDHQPIGAVAIGHPGGGDRQGRSAARPRRDAGEVLHRGGW